MRYSVVFLVGLLTGSAMATGGGQGQRLTGENYVNHIALAVENFDNALTFYTQKMGFREAFVIKDTAGKPIAAYVQVSRSTFVELQQASPTRKPGLNHFGLHVENLKATVATLKSRGVIVDNPLPYEADSSFAHATDPNGIRIELFEFGPGSLQGKAIASWK
jgi:catechol 2,3-dioxygenase-like lactoylglutathione lyase family enzyme